MDRSSKQKINKETQVLNDTLDEMDLIDNFRTFHPNGKQKKAGVAILISDKIDLKIKITRDNDYMIQDYIMIKGSIQEEGITIVNIYAPNMLLLLLSHFSHVRPCVTP